MKCFEPIVGEMDDITDLALQAKTGNADAFALLVRRTQGEMWRYVCRMTDNQRADDITQDVYIRIWKALPSFVATSSARTWMYGVAHHVVADHVRTISRRRRLLENVGRSATPGTLEHKFSLEGAARSPRDHAEYTVIEEFVTQLNTDHRAAFVLTQVLGFSYAESAEILSVPIGTVRSRLARAREALVTQIEAAEAV